MYKLFSYIFCTITILSGCQTTQTPQTHTDHFAHKSIVTVAGPVHVCRGNEEYIALVKRAKNPHGYGMVGGHIGANDVPENAFRREIHSELNIKNPKDIRLVGVFDAYADKNHKHALEIVYSAISHEYAFDKMPAEELLLLKPQNLLELINTKPEDFAFNHAHILKNYLSNPHNLGRCSK